MDTPEYSPSGFSLKIFRDRYAFTETETWQEACLRVAHQMAIAESPDRQKIYVDRFYDVLVKNLFVPGGRIWYNSGRTNPQLLNCFVLDPNKDSKEGWGKSAYDMIVTSMTGGGCGDDFSDVRPRGASIGGQRGAAPGAVELMRLIDACAQPVRNGGQRRVALMFSLDLSHPDIEEFLSAKLTKGELTHANVSVRSRHTKAFIKAVKDDGEIELHWKGKYKRQIKARVLWDTIVRNAYNSAEPGFLNWELVEHESNIYYIEDLVTTNPCGELALATMEPCCLGHIVLSRFVVDGEIDYSCLGDTIRLAVRFLDDALSVNHFPLEEMKVKSNNLRRIGLGTTALADTLALLGHRYGSEEGNKFIDKLYRFISKAAYEASVLLAIEKGAFPLCHQMKHVESGFMKRMPSKTRSLVLEHGIRNCAILTQAPTGTVSILSENCSSGIEPMFAPAYERRYWDNEVRKTELVFHPLFEKFMIEGKSVEHFVGTHDLTARDHMEVQKIIQRHVDNAVSKTINLPVDYDMADMEKLWLEYLPYLKGTTFYRETTRGYINKAGEVEAPPLTAIPLKEAKKRFKETHKVEAAQVTDCPTGVCNL
jgi:ribonucleoside-diphosphate reductase alpha chain